MWAQMALMTFLNSKQLPCLATKQTLFHGFSLRYYARVVTVQFLEDMVHNLAVAQSHVHPTIGIPCEHNSFVCLVKQGDSYGSLQLRYMYLLQLLMQGRLCDRMQGTVIYPHLSVYFVCHCHPYIFMISMNSDLVRAVQLIQTPKQKLMQLHVVVTILKFIKLLSLSPLPHYYCRDGR